MADNPLDRFIRGQSWMDPVAEFVQKVVGGFYSVLGPPGRGLKSLLHGSSPLGHPLHPAITDLPMGAWVTAVILDLVAHYNRSIPHGAASVALLVGVIAAVGAAITGYTDFHETYGHERRVGLLHGLTMTVVLILMVVSLALRHWGGDGSHTAAVVVSFAGALLMLFGGYVGGHLVFGMGTMVNRNAFAAPPDSSIDIGLSADFPEGQVKRVDAQGFPVMVVRSQGKICAIGAVCSHAGGPLDEGEFAKGRIKCPWHGSEFDVCTGAVRTGPATFDQPYFNVSERDGHVAIQSALPGH